jgi:hypothetical protein
MRGHGREMRGGPRDGISQRGESLGSVDGAISRCDLNEWLPERVVAMILDDWLELREQLVAWRVCRLWHRLLDPHFCTQVKRGKTFCIISCSRDISCIYSFLDLKQAKLSAINLALLSDPHIQLKSRIKFSVAVHHSSTTPVQNVAFVCTRIIALERARSISTSGEQLKPIMYDMPGVPVSAAVVEELVTELATDDRSGLSIFESPFTLRKKAYVLLDLLVVWPLQIKHNSYLVFFFQLSRVEIILLLTIRYPDWETTNARGRKIQWRKLWWFAADTGS